MKGRHPLLKDVDVNFNPSKGLPPVESRASNKRVQLNKHTSISPTDSSGYTLEPINKILQDIQSRSRKDSQRDLKLDEKLRGVENGVVQQRASVDAELIEHDSADPVVIESGYTLEAINKILQDIQSRSRKDSQRDLKLDEELQGDENGVVQQRTSVDAELIEQDSADPVDIESGQAQQTAEVVMNLLDVMMPGTLTKEKKKVILRIAILAIFTEV